jgi:hypothetical protein
VFVALGAHFILFGLATLLAGTLAYLVAAHRQREWPFEQNTDIAARRH